MTADDHAALARIGRHMAATNGYRPEQASDLYITRGTTKDYEYGTYRIFAYTFELSIKDYPDDSKIASETGRNKEAVLYLMERAGCPYAVLGAALRIARCGAFDDDLEVARGWTVNPDGTDTAPARGTIRPGRPGADQPVRTQADRDGHIRPRRPRDGEPRRSEADVVRPRRLDRASGRPRSICPRRPGST